VEYLIGPGMTAFHEADTVFNVHTRLVDIESSVERTHEEVPAAWQVLHYNDCNVSLQTLFWA
jgi:hypothetical protein